MQNSVELHSVLLLKMERTRKSVIFIGDQTDSWIDRIDYITKNAKETPWLKSFMRDLCYTIKNELKDMEPAVTKSLGNTGVS